MSSFRILLAVLLMPAIICLPAVAEKRVALVIGNSKYAQVPALPNPANDANDISSALKRAGFEVILGLDACSGEAIVAVVTAPPLQLSSELQRQIPDPNPPVALNSAGKPRYKTNPRTGEAVKENGQLVPLLDHTNESYLLEAASVERARTIAMIFSCTKFPGESSVVRNGESPVAFELARWKELEQAGCGIGVYNDLSVACLDLSRSMTKAEIEQARRELGTDEESSDLAKASLKKKDVPKGK